MSDNWSLDLARDLEVVETEVAPAPISSPSGCSELEFYDYVEQSTYGATTDDGYVSCSSSLSDGDKVKNGIIKVDVKRLKKNATQKAREMRKSKSLNELRDIIIKHLNVQPKGRRRFTELVTLNFTKRLLKQLVIPVERH